jgi:glycosyltransferase 2 family protein
MKKLHAVLLALGVAFFAYLLWTVGVQELWRELALLGWGLIPLMLGEGVAEMIHAVGWRHCLNGPYRSLPWRTLFGIRMAGYAINYLTPTAALGGEVTKAALLASHHRGAGAASGVLIGKLCFALAHLLFVILGAGLILWRVPLPGTLWLAMLVSGGLVASGIVTFLLLQKHGKLGALVRWLAARKLGGRPLEKAARDLTAVDDAMERFYRERPWDLALAIGCHLVGFSVGIAQTWLFCRLLHQEASWSVAAGAWFLGMWFDLLTFAVPLNLGTLEGTRIIAFKAIGYSALTGMTYGIALRLAQLFWAGFGLVTHAMLASRLTALNNALAATNRLEPSPVRAIREAAPRKADTVRAQTDARRAATAPFTSPAGAEDGLSP